MDELDLETLKVGDKIIFAFPNAKGVEAGDLEWAQREMTVGKEYTFYLREGKFIVLFEYNGVLLSPALFKKQ